VRPLLAGALVLIAPIAIRQVPTFKAETRLVVLQATVRDPHGTLITNLERDAFTVFENGKRQPITLFRRDDVPVSLGLLIDNSGSMRPLRAKVEAAALAFAHASNPLDEMFVINFADTPHLDVPFTTDRAVLERGIARVDAIGGTALRDAVDAAQRYLAEHGTRDRKVILVVTDGIDNASSATMEAIQRQAEERDTVIYAIGLFGADPSRIRHGRHELDALAERTGGVAVYPADIDQIDSAVLDLAHQIRNQYTIAYAPLNQALDGTYRSIRVEVAGREHMTVRTRAGYRAGQLP
jgi:Ca-activated chloride channel family protein